MLTISLHATFHVISSSGSLLSASKLKANYRFHRAIILFIMCKKIALTKTSRAIMLFTLYKEIPSEG